MALPALLANPQFLAALAQAGSTLMGGRKGPPAPAPPTAGRGFPMENTTTSFLQQGSVQNPPPVNTPSPLTSTGPPGGFKPVTPVTPAAPTPDSEMAPDFNTTLGYAQMAAGAGGALGSLFADRNRPPSPGGMAGRPFQMQPSMRLGDLMQRRRYY
jgi:hypothetical protein